MHRGTHSRSDAESNNDGSNANKQNNGTATHATNHARTRQPNRNERGCEISSVHLASVLRGPNEHGGWRGLQGAGTSRSRLASSSLHLGTEPDRARIPISSARLTPAAVRCRRFSSSDPAAAQRGSGGAGCGSRATPLSLGWLRYPSLPSLAFLDLSSGYGADWGVAARSAPLHL
jgi:hypothetical protein